jgi:hypothetical protein
LAANVVYQWEILTPNPPPKAGFTTHYAFTGLEYLYGERETLGKGAEHAHRVQFTIGMKF